MWNSVVTLFWFALGCPRLSWSICFFVFFAPSSSCMEVYIGVDDVFFSFSQRVERFVLELSRNSWCKKSQNFGMFLGFSWCLLIYWPFMRGCADHASWCWSLPGCQCWWRLESLAKETREWHQPNHQGNIIYSLVCHFWGFYVGKYSSTMEHLGMTENWWFTSKKIMWLVHYTNSRMKKRGSFRIIWGVPLLTVKNHLVASRNIP